MARIQHRGVMCSICSHPERGRIEMLRASGVSLDSLATTFSVTRDSVFRHMKNHVNRDRIAALMLGPAQVERLAIAAAKESGTILDHLTIVRSVLLTRFLASAEVGDSDATARTAGKLLLALRQLAELSGELRATAGITVNNSLTVITASPVWVDLTNSLLAVCRKHPAARADIIAALREVEAKGDAPLAIEPPALELEAADAP